MTRVWDAEHVVTGELARTLIQEQFPDIQPSTIEPLGKGFDNTAYVVNGSYVFRFPRRQIAVGLLLTEMSALPELSKHVALPIPVPSWQGKPGHDFPWPFSGHRLIPGRTACGLDLSDAERTALAAPLGTFLAELHSLPVEQGRQWGLKNDPIGKLDLPKKIPEARKYLQEVENLVPGLNSRRLTEIIDASARLTPDEEPAVLHGDMHVRHILVGESHQLAGIIDWGDVHVGQRAVDLSVAHSFLPPAAHAAFRTAYGDISDNAWNLARFRALFVACVIAAYGHDSNDPDFAREGQRALTYLSSN